MSDTGRGITTLAHVQQLLMEAEARVAAASHAVAGTLSPAQREQLGRSLAGVVGTCETVRLWLAAGGPR